MLKLFLINRRVSACSGARWFLISSQMSPVLEKSLSEGTEVGLTDIVVPT